MNLCNIKTWTLFIIMTGLVNSCLGTCAFNPDCVVPSGTTIGELCVLTLTFMDCLNTTIVQNDQCTISIQRNWAEKIQDIQKLIWDSGCLHNNASHVGSGLLACTAMRIIIMILYAATGQKCFQMIATQEKEKM